MQESSDRALLVETLLGREIQNIDTAKLAVRSVQDQPLNGGHRVGIRRLPQHRDQGSGFAHPRNPTLKVLEWDAADITPA